MKKKTGIQVKRLPMRCFMHNSKKIIFRRSCRGWLFPSDTHGRVQLAFNGRHSRYFCSQQSARGSNRRPDVSRSDSVGSGALQQTCANRQGQERVFANSSNSCIARHLNLCNKEFPQVLNPLLTFFFILTR